MEARDAGRANPLKAGLEYPLDLEIPQQHPGARPVPRLSAGGSTARDPVVLSLKDPLQTRVGYLSQVWTAEVVGASQVSLVMKIIQPSWCRFPWREDSYEAYDFAHNEAWAYRNMAHLQGLSIPYFFGLFEIQTPSGEAAWALVLEFIPGRTVNEVAASRCKEDIQAFVSNHHPPLRLYPTQIQPVRTRCCGHPRSSRAGLVPRRHPGSQLHPHWPARRMDGRHNRSV
ncbi:hypothetical protein DFH06DRAFT_975508 [Mycena polygramma]|nr:hypothetical protein DFH06DRAFT_975508 [Mycena polygramma]